MLQKQARLLEGKTLAGKIQDEIRQSIDKAISRGWERPCLRVMQVTEDPSSKWYIGQQKKAAGKLGMSFDDSLTPEQLSQPGRLMDEIISAGRDSKVHGIFITMPLPAGLDADEVLLKLDPRKDVEGIHPSNLGLIVLRKTKIIPPTAFAAFRLLQSTGMELRGRKAVIIGQSAIVGRPLQMLLGEERVTTVVCNTGTPLEELEKQVSEADIVIACAGRPNLVRGVWIKPGAAVIDVGTTEVDGKLAGDVEFEPAAARAAFITPVPGGVGPLTVTMLMQNLMRAYQWQKGIQI